MAIRKTARYLALATALALNASAEIYEPGPNLPTQGRSAFDHLIARNGGKVPDNLSAMIDLIKAQFGDAQGAFLPEGRSLARFATDFKDPRTVFSGRRDSGTLPSSSSDLLHRFDSSSIYLGHASKTNSLEVISYNPRLARYEFQVVRDFGPGLKPVVEYSDRALCMTCHQHGGPIFSTGPWSETENNAKVAQAMLEKNPHFETHGLNGGQDFMIPAGDKAFTRVFGFDANVQRGSGLLFAQELFRRGCGTSSIESSECRRLIAELAFIDRSSKSKDREKYKEQLARLDELLTKSWPKDGIPMSEGELPNRDPFKDPNTMPLSPYLDPLSERSSKSPKYREFFRNRAGNSFQQDQFEVLKQAAAIFNDDDVTYIKNLAGGDVDKIHAALKSPSMTEFFDGRAIVKSDLYRELLKNLGHPVEQDLWKIEESKMPPMILAGQVMLDGSAKLSGQSAGHLANELHLFKKNCASCHTGQSEPRMNFMEAASDEALMRQIRTNPEIARRLSWESVPEAQRMPPQRSKQGQSLRGPDAQGRLGMLHTINRKGCVEAIESALHL